jgi:hypothetical protein
MEILKMMQTRIAITRNWNHGNPQNDANTNRHHNETGITGILKMMETRIAIIRNWNHGNPQNDANVNHHH